MKKATFILLTVISLFAISCGNKTDNKENNSDSTNNNQNTEVKESCKYSADMFGNFLGLKMGATYDDAVKLFGKPSSETQESDYKTCEWNGDTRYPLIMYIDNKSKKITEIYLEVLGVDANLNTDIQDAIAEYKINDCYASLFGISQKEFEQKMGKPKEVRREEKNDDIDYYSKDNKFMITFGFWKEQQMKCTSFDVIWE